MVRRHQCERSVFEVLLLDGHKLWPDWLRRIDTLLEDEAVIEVVAQSLETRRPQSRRRGRPGTPAELRKEVGDGWNEFSCHPGYVSEDYVAVYLGEREAEVRTLTDPAIGRTIEDLGIQLVSYGEFPRRPHDGFRGTTI